MGECWWEIRAERSRVLRSIFDAFGTATRGEARAPVQKKKKWPLLHGNLEAQNPVNHKPREKEEILERKEISFRGGSPHFRCPATFPAAS